jgi:G protein beta subunit-like protein
LCITPDKRSIAAAGNPLVKLFDVESNSPGATASFDGHTGNVMAVGFNRTAQWMHTGAEDGTVKIWDIRAPGCQRDMESRSAVNTVALHPNERELISGDQAGNIRIWDLTMGTCMRELVPEPDNAIRSLSVSANGGILVAAAGSGTCFVWRLSDGEGGSTQFEPLHRLDAHKTYCLHCEVSPDTKLLATTSADRTVKLWNCVDFSLEKTLVGHQRWTWDCVFSADSAYIVTASSDNTAKLWDVANGTCIRTYTGHVKACVTVALNDCAIEE